MDFTECYGDTVSSVAAAARSGCRRRVRRLIKRGFSVDCRDNRGWNALHEAAAGGSRGCVQELLSSLRGKKGYYTTQSLRDESSVQSFAKFSLNIKSAFYIDIQREVPPFTAAPL